MGDAEDLIQAVQKNDLARAKELLAKDSNLILTKTRDGSLLQTAAYYGSKDVVKALLPRFPQMNIYEACAVGDATRLRHVLDEEPDLANAPNHDGFTPLGLAAFFGHKAAVQVLLSRGAEVDRLDQSRFANTALDAAVAGDRTEVVKFLLEHHASVNVRSAGGATPLQKAAQNGNLEVCRLLLDRGAEIGARDDKGKGPLDYATEAGHEAVAALLRERAAGARTGS